MKPQTYANDKGEIVATGRITPTYIDLILNDGTRYYSTFSIDFIKKLNISKVENNEN